MTDNSRKTISSIFLVPLVGISRSKLKEHGFINGYLSDGERELQYKDSVYLLFKPNNIESFRDFLEDEYDRTKNIIEDYEGGYVVLVYKLDSRFTKDISLVKKGKYSMTSKVFQSEFPKMITVPLGSTFKEEISLQYRIFNKTKDLKEFWEKKLDVKFDDNQEVWSAFEDDKEVLFIRDLKDKEHV